MLRVWGLEEGDSRNTELMVGLHNAGGRGLIRSGQEVRCGGADQAQTWDLTLFKVNPKIDP